MTSHRVIIVANRLPITVRVEDGDVEVTPSSGGLVTALGHIHARPDSRWIGWAGDPGRTNDVDRERVASTLLDRGLIQVELTAGEVVRYYDGFSNGVLWPLFHYMTDRLRRSVTPDWNAYRQVNERFAATTAEVARPGDLVWIHDYHLMLTPALVRRRLPEALIGFFLHIPFPAADVFRILPWREALLRGLLAADVVGFHTADYAQHFRYAATQLVGAVEQGDELSFEDRCVRVGAYPIGIDASRLAARATEPDVAALAEEWRRRVHDHRIVLGVDRLDYTKGIPRRLLAIERLFEQWPDWRERLQFVQLAVPTRERGDEYVAFRREVHELVGRINGRFGTPGWTPIHFVHRSVNPTELSALYRVADVMLVTPLRDGMNLVAKEYCASRVDERGALVLSEMAGAAAELREALLVNPYDVHGVAAAIRRGLMMSPAEQEVRMRALRATVAGNDIDGWADRFLGDLARVPPQPGGPIAVDAATTPLSDALVGLRAAPRRLLLLDYDGTLVPFAALPDLAFPDDELRTLLASLAGDPSCSVHVLSGRGRASLDAWLGDLPIGLHAEHGFWARWPGEDWSSAPLPATEALAEVEAMMVELVRRTPGTFVERKDASRVWHYRMAEPLLAVRRLDELRRRMVAVIPPGLEILEGAKVLEVRGQGVNKGAAARHIVERMAAPDGNLAVLAIGDDRTDEELFAALGSEAITIRVGPGVTCARHRVEGPHDVRALLRGLR